MMMTAFLVVACDDQSMETEARRWDLRPRPLQVICEEEQPITGDDYCPTAIVRACLTPQAIPAIPESSQNPRPAPGTFGNIDEYVNELNTDFDACMASNECFNPDTAFLESRCCAAEMHWGWLQARRTCLFDYGVGTLYFSEGPCRRMSLDLECQMECWTEHADCYRDGNFFPSGVCEDAMVECYQTCRDAYGSAIPGQPWWYYPGPWTPDENGG